MKPLFKYPSKRLSILAFSIVALATIGCQQRSNESDDHTQHNHQQHGASASADSASKPDTKYQCSMHPNIVADQAGKCPICGMDLQPVKPIALTNVPGRSAVSLTDRQRQLINLRTTEVERIRAIKTFSVPGVIQHDHSKVYTISAWTSGRIEELIVNQEETEVHKGDPLYHIYSPTIYAALQDYANLTRGSVQNQALIESARFRLLQLGLLDDQIDALKGETDIPRTIEIRSQANGLVMMKKINQGQYIKEGDSLYTLVDLSELWLIVDIYESDLTHLATGQRVTASTPAVPNEQFTGSITLINHHVDPQTRTAKARVGFDGTETSTQSVSNPHGHRLLPDMWMTARIEKDLGEQLVIPREALFDTGNRQYVFVEEEPGRYTPQAVNIGAEIENHIIINSGLEAGDRVVFDGVFLLDSESLLRASASGDTRDSASREASPQAHVHGLPFSAQESLDLFWKTYFEIRDSLTADRIDSLSTQIDSLQQNIDSLKDAQHLPATGKSLYLKTLNSFSQQLSHPHSTVKEARILFGHLSQAIITWAQATPEAIPSDLHIASCPMWTSSPAQWIQTETTIENPFMGSAMLQCGAIEETLNALKR